MKKLLAKQHRYSIFFFFFKIPCQTEYFSDEMAVLTGELH